MSDDRRPIISVGGLDESGSENEFDSRNIGADASSILSEEDGVFGDVNGKLQAATHDWLNMTYIIIYLQGVGSLLPWNFFITARGYFEMKFKGDANIQNMFESAFSVAAMIPNVLSLLVNVFLTKQVNRNLRMLTCLFVTLVCFILTAAFVRIDTSSWTKEFFGVTIGIVALINMACAIYGGTFFGVAGVIGQKYTQAMMGGQGLGGTFAALASILSLVIGSKPEDSAFGYFLTAVMVTLVCLVAYFIFFRLAYVKYCLNRNEFRSLRGSQASTKPSINALTASSSSLLSVTSLGSSFSSTQYPIREKTPYLQILKDLSPMSLSVSFVFVVTLSLYPSVVSGIQSVNKDSGDDWTNSLFSPLVCFLLFNVGDLTGRTLAGIVPCFSEKSILLRILCISRVVFIPLFALCNYSPDHRRFPVYLKHDVYPVIINVFFSISNGYLSSLCMMYGPKLVNPKYAEVAGTIMALFLSLFLSCGLALGAGLSFAITAIILH
eukprot:gene11198-21339_t